MLSVTKSLSSFMSFLASIISSSSPLVLPLEIVPLLSRMSFIVVKVLVVETLKLERSSDVAFCIFYISLNS